MKIEIDKYNQEMRRLDANETSFVSEQLTLINNVAIQPNYSDLKAAQFIPFVFRNYTGIRRERFTCLEHWGKAAIVADCAADVPKATSGMRSYDLKIERLRSCYSICFEEMEAAIRTGTPLDINHGQSVRRAIDEALDCALAYGFAATDVNGLLTNPDVSVIGLPNAGTWDTLTPEQVLANLEALANGGFAGGSCSRPSSLNPNLILLDPVSYAATRQIYSASFPGLTVGGVFLANTDSGITGIECWQKLSNTADDAIGNGGNPRVVSYRRDPAVLAAYLDTVRAETPYQKCREMVHEFKQAIAGVNVRQPGGVTFADIV